MYAFAHIHTLFELYDTCIYCSHQLYQVVVEEDALMGSGNHLDGVRYLRDIKLRFRYNFL